MRTTKIVVEESSPDISGTFTFHSPPRKSEFRVEEVESSLNTSKTEDEILPPSENVIIENFESIKEQQSKSLNASRQVSIVSVTSDENKTEDNNDDVMEDLLYRIKKQRSDLENILGIERKEEEQIAKKQKITEKAIEKDEKVVKEGIFHLKNF